MILKLTDTGSKQDYFRIIRNLQGKQAFERARVANGLIKNERDHETNYTKKKRKRKVPEDAQFEATYGHGEPALRRTQHKH